jgi:hypothetical protein
MLRVKVLLRKDLLHCSVVTHRQLPSHDSKSSSMLQPNILAEKATDKRKQTSNQKEQQIQTSSFCLTTFIHSFILTLTFQ